MGERMKAKFAIVTRHGSVHEAGMVSSDSQGVWINTGAEDPNHFDWNDVEEIQCLDCAQPLGKRSGEWGYWRAHEC